LQGADIFEINNNGTTILLYSKEAWLKTGDSSLFNLCINLGLDIFQIDYKGKSLVDYCREEGIERIGSYLLPLSQILCHKC